MSSFEPPHNAVRQRRLLAVAGLAGLAWLAGCGGTPKAPPPQPTAAPVEPPPAPPPPAPVQPSAPPAPPRLEPVPDVQAAVRQVQNLLQDGDVQAAEALCRRILATDPAQPQALSLLRQIETDPVQIFGRESHAHVVRPGETLATIARDRLRDANLFYALARLNGIKVPRQLAAGQTIRVPGRAPAATAAPAPAPAPSPAPASAPAAPAPEPAPAPAAPVPAPPQPVPPPAPAAAPVTPAALLRRARTEVARQNLCAGIRSYDELLALEPGHAAARAERQRAADLLERLRRQGSKLEC